MSENKIYKVIFHIDSSDYFNKLINNLNNLLLELNNNNENAKILVLANGSAVKGYYNKEIINKINGLNTIEFIACSNSLKAHKLDQNQLNSNISVTSSGVYFLVLKMDLGYNYIKV